ncbi:hypothetical protein [Mucilaginibacter segetis]|uniref:Uncharacterized protein n=1 Tax=Mucilaginibacter segetis TaxID=2793071 RepID=A0A934PSW1_9SPHI|nr:hypothetical protein [Mucilaginibacter segetis]MBK0378581.1 hypothetical protein [Mucilaginibacter segetis]
MKKAILTIALLACAAVTFGQTTKEKAKPDTSKYQPDPKRVYQIGLTGDQLSSLMGTSQEGVIPYLKKIKLPMDKLDDAQVYFQTIQTAVATQFRKQYVADSLSAVKPLAH